MPHDASSVLYSISWSVQLTFHPFSEDFWFLNFFIFFWMAELVNCVLLEVSINLFLTVDSVVLCLHLGFSVFGSRGPRGFSDFEKYFRSCSQPTPSVSWWLPVPFSRKIVRCYNQYVGESTFVFVSIKILGPILSSGVILDGPSARSWLRIPREKLLHACISRLTHGILLLLLRWCWLWSLQWVTCILFYLFLRKDQPRSHGLR